MKKVGTPFGNRLRRLRQEKGLTMEKLAEAVGVSKSYIWELENKPAERTSANVINKLAMALDVTPADLMGAPPPEALGDKANPEDVRFFRNYMVMDNDDRETYRKMLEFFKKQKGK